MDWFSLTFYSIFLLKNNCCISIFGIFTNYIVKNKIYLCKFILSILIVILK
jgi:hypothetical protein